MKILVEKKLRDLGINVEALSASAIEAFYLATDGLAHQARDEWIRLAQRRLKTSQTDYVAGLQKADSFRSRITARTHIHEIRLIGRMPNNYEFGMPSFDMKSARPGWLGGTKAKISKEGKKYVTIPFRHPITSTRNIGYTGKAKAANLRPQLRRVVKKYGLDRMIRAATGQVIPGPVKRVPTRPRARTGIHPYLRGLTRVQQPTGPKKMTGTSTLMTFRRMSEDSPIGSWIHPGLKGVNLLPEVVKFVNNELENTAKKIVKAA